MDARRWTRAAQPVTCPEWLAAFERVRWLARNAESVRLLVSDEVHSPLSWGWRRPVILIDPDTLGQPDDAEAILAHEVAHVARRDWPVLMLSRLAATLFWFNPLVWLLEREVVQQAEEAADCEAAERVEPARYAETLLSWAQVNGRWSRPTASRRRPARSAGGSGRSSTGGCASVPAGSAWTAVAMLLCLGIAAPVAAMQLVAARAAGSAGGAAGAPGAAALRTRRRRPPPGAPAAAGRAAPRRPPSSSPATECRRPRCSDEVAAERRSGAGRRAAADPDDRRDARRIDRGRASKRRMRDAQVAGQTRMPRHERGRDPPAMREARRASRPARRSRQRDGPARRCARRSARSGRGAVSMAHGADGMERGADGMERAPDRMEEQADRLRSDRAYREREIARARARGETVTHEDLLEAAEGHARRRRGHARRRAGDARGRPGRCATEHD